MSERVAAGSERLGDVLHKGIIKVNMAKIGRSRPPFWAKPAAASLLGNLASFREQKASAARIGDDVATEASHIGSCVACLRQSVIRVLFGAVFSANADGTIWI
jgi:hypothetical protein